MISRLNVTVRAEENYAVIQTEGYLNGPMGENLAESARGLINKGYNRLIINLEKTRHINSVGISILIEIVELLEAQGGYLYFCGLTPVIERTFKIMGLAQHTAVFPDEDSAIANL